MKNIYDISNYYYELDKSKIAQKPLKKRDSSRLLILDKNTGKIIHERFYNIYKYLKKGDCIVLNNTKVIPARLYGEKEETGAKIEILFHDFNDNNSAEVMMKNSRRVESGDYIIFPGGLKAKVIQKKGKTVDVEFNFNREKVISILKKYGKMPLPPYIKENKDAELHKKTYQTIYSKKEGAKAAPTAGFHFTKNLINKLKKKGINIVELTLHVGLGTFEPLLEKDIRKHKMHYEYFELDDKAAEMINKAKENGKSIIAVGTTVLRTLEHCAKNGKVIPQKGKTNLYIYPGYEFKVVDKLITNFHLPKTTLFVLVCAFAGIDNAKNAYREAIRENYRFYSYGDAMFIR